MARRRPCPVGQCHICGKTEQLTLEHVPPASAFNNRPVLRQDIFRLLGIGEGGRDRLEQGGASECTLCSDCNNNTGAWYGGAFVDFAEQGMTLLTRAAGGMSLAYGYWFFPLRVIKQILAMFASANGPEFFDRNPYLRTFLLNKERTGLPPEFRIYSFYTLGPYGRQSGIAARLGWTDQGGFRGSTFSEISFPPFGFVLAISSAPLDPHMVDITYFARFPYNDWCQQFLDFRVLPTASPLPGDFRPPEEIWRAMTRPPGEQSQDED